MSTFEEKLLGRIKRLERGVERLQVKESPIMSNYLLTTGKAADSDKLDGIDSAYFMPASYANGWIPVSATWTYASATTITVPSGATAIYKVGQGIKLTQTDVKYFYIVGVADTLLTITGGSDYTLTNAAISAISYTNTPGAAIGFPDVFNFTPVFTSLTVTGSPIYSGKFWMSGVLKFYSIQINPNGGTTASVFGSTLMNNPVAQSGFTVPVAVFYTSNATGNFGETSTTQTYLPTWTTNSGYIFISATYI